MPSVLLFDSDEAMLEPGALTKVLKPIGNILKMFSFVLQCVATILLE